MHDKNTNLILGTSTYSVHKYITFQLKEGGGE